jgi:hypothetical protein
MTANEWREKTKQAARERAVVLTLPSGMSILARRPDPVQFAQWGMLPTALARAEEVGAENISDEEAEKIATIMRDLLIYCCLDPAISLEPGINEIHPREIGDADWMFIIAWSMRLKEAAELRPFRGGRPNGGAAGGGKAVLLQTVGAPGDRRSGAGAGVRPGGGAADDRAAEGRD